MKKIKNKIFESINMEQKTMNQGKNIDIRLMVYQVIVEYGEQNFSQYWNLR